MKRNKPKSHFELMPIENYNPEWEGISFEAFLEKRKDEIEPTALAIMDKLIKLGGISINEKLFSDKLDYLIQTNKSFENKHLEVLELWDLLAENIKEKEKFDLNNAFSIYIYPLLSISIESKVPLKDLESKEQNLHIAIMTKLINKIDEKKSELSISLDEIFNWYNNRLSFLGELKLGPLSNESTIIKTIIEENTELLEKIKTQSPHTYINFLALFKILYINNLEYKAKHKRFYIEQCKNQILVCKSNNIYFDYYEIIKDFQKLNLEKKKWQFYALDFFAGFGEKPMRVVFWFFVFDILFTVLFFCLGIQIKGINSLENSVEKFFTYLYFNNTTMLTVGYGDHYPVTIEAKMCVLILQILGFVFSASAISLYLRKIFRE